MSASPRASAAYPVTHIDHQAFYDKQLTSVVLGRYIWTIGSRAFANNQLAYLALPDHVFQGFPGIDIGSGAFASNKLENVAFGQYIVIGSGAFQYNQLSKVRIPCDTTAIPGNAFANNHLVCLYIHDRVEYIGVSAFANNNLDRIIIPDSVARISPRAFWGNDITEITIGPDVYLPAWLGALEAFPNGFDDFYRENGSRAGTYTFDGERWHAEFR